MNFPDIFKVSLSDPNEIALCDKLFEIMNTIESNCNDGSTIRQTVDLYEFLGDVTGDPVHDGCECNPWVVKKFLEQGEEDPRILFRLAVSKKENALVRPGREFEWQSYDSAIWKAGFDAMSRCNN